MTSNNDNDRDKVGDAWGAALLDHFDGRPVPPPQLEVDDGTVVPAMHPGWFFRAPGAWDWWDRELLALVDTGPVLDLGAGAGRASIHLQDLGIEVTAVEGSPGAADVCRRRGVRDVRDGDLNDPPADRPWATVLLLCGNLGLGGTWEGNRSLLRRLAQITAPGALLIGDSVNYEGRPEIGLRIRYKDLVTPWWRQRNVSRSEIPALIEGTGWVIERQLEDGPDHAIALRRAPSPPCSYEQTSRETERSPTPHGVPIGRSRSRPRNIDRARISARRERPPAFPVRRSVARGM